MCQDGWGQVRIGQDGSGQDRSKQDRLEQEGTGRGRKGGDRSGQVRTGQDLTGVDRMRQDRLGQVRTSQNFWSYTNMTALRSYARYVLVLTIYFEQKFTFPNCFTQFFCYRFWLFIDQIGPIFFSPIFFDWHFLLTIFLSKSFCAPKIILVNILRPKLDLKTKRTKKFTKTIQTYQTKLTIPNLPMQQNDRAKIENH